jgi:hypothetical protein
MPDLPTLLESIGENPDDEARWRALSLWLWDDGRDDEAAAVRVLWATLRDNLTTAGGSPRETLADVARHANVLGQLAREIEARDESQAHPPGR